MTNLRALLAMALPAICRDPRDTTSTRQRAKPPHRTTKNTKRSASPKVRGIKHPDRRGVEANRVYCIKGSRP